MEGRGIFLFPSFGAWFFRPQEVMRMPDDSHSPMLGTPRVISGKR